ncbi:MAG: glucose 1-dehydrogenase [Anaerolineae bacterium]|jgi:NAD(P)-dependent dehydrogenase (short-subunit alcohol dehydrogenase family)
MQSSGKKLDGKTAIITGGASGIGQATARLFAREGATVVVADIDSTGGNRVVDELRQRGADAIFVPTDVTIASDVQHMIESTVETYGKLDILFNNAGIGHRIPVHECSEEDWDRVIAVDLKGVFLGCKYGIQVMLEQGGGTIINTASGAGLLGAPRSPAYSAAKGGVVILTRQIANDYAQQNIRINAICPGAVDTPLMNVVYREISDDLQEAKRIYEARLPRGRLIHPEEVAHAALYLASDETRFITGNPFFV